VKKLQVRLIALLLAVILVAGLLPARAEAASSKPYLIKVNKKMNVVTVYKKDSSGNYTVPVKAMLCSTGADTPLGTYKTPAKYRWKVLMGNVWGQYSTRIVNGILFHSVWYYSQNAATQSTRQFNNLGKSVSHGCVRLTTADCKWIYDNCPLGTTVVIYSSSNPGPLGTPDAIKVSESTKMGYDPTDIWTASNPYKKKTPKISGTKNQTIQYGAKSVNVLKNVKATSITGQDITSKIETTIKLNGKTVKKVDTKVGGKYKVTYKVTDVNTKTTKKTVTFTVVDDTKPKLTVSGDLYWNKDKTVTKKIALSGVTAKWHGKSYIDDVTYKTKVTTEEDGLKVYKITYTLKTTNGKSATATRKIYVDTKAPTVTVAENRELTVTIAEGETFSVDKLDTAKLLEGVTVSDNVTSLSASDISVSVEAAEEENTYKVTYTVKDEAGNQTVTEALVKLTIVIGTAPAETTPPAETTTGPAIDVTPATDGAISATDSAITTTGGGVS
jgi:hypothetical protein